MQSQFYQKSFTICLMFVFLCLVFQACTQSQNDKKGKIEVISSKLTVQQIKDNKTITYVLNASGKIRNTGTVDVKKVVVTGWCRNCTKVMTSNSWFVSDYAKTDNQKDIIGYLSAGAEENFSFQEIAVYMATVENPPEITNEKIDIVIESYEVVKGGFQLKPIVRIIHLNLD